MDAHVNSYVPGAFLRLIGGSSEQELHLILKAVLGEHEHHLSITAS